MKTSNDEEIEKSIIKKGLTAPRITPQLIDACIINTDFHVFPGSQTTICCITLNNGYTVTGESACASPENFDEGIGKRIAYGNAKDRIWMLEGYLLKQKLFEQNLSVGK